MSNRIVTFLKRFHLPWMPQTSRSRFTPASTDDNALPPGIEPCTDFELHREVWSLPNLPGVLIDIDIGPDGDWVALCAGTEAGMCVVTPRSVLPVPGLNNRSLIRWVGKNRIALLWADELDPSKNMELRTPDGCVVHVIRVDWRTIDALVLGDRVAVLYDEQGSYRNEYPGREGLCVFTLQGDIEFRHFTDLRDPPDPFIDCSNICFIAPDVVGFMSDLFEDVPDNLPFVLLNISTRRQTVHPSPFTFDFSLALTWDGQAIIIYGSNNDRNEFYRWVPGAETAQKIGEYDGRLRDFGHGRFLEITPTGGAVLSFRKIEPR